MACAENDQPVIGRRVAMQLFSQRHMLMQLIDVYLLLLLAVLSCTMLTVQQMCHMPA